MSTLKVCVLRAPETFIWNFLGMKILCPELHSLNLNPTGGQKLKRLIPWLMSSANKVDSGQVFFFYYYQTEMLWNFNRKTIEAQINQFKIIITSMQKHLEEICHSVFKNSIKIFQCQVVFDFPSTSKFNHNWKWYSNSQNQKTPMKSPEFDLNSILECFVKMFLSQNTCEI